VQRGFGPAAQKKSHTRVDDDAPAGDAGSFERRDALGKETADEVPHLVRRKLPPLRPATPLHRVHDDEPGPRRRQFRIKRRVGKALDVVQEIDAAGDREALHLGQKAVDRHARGIGFER